MNPAEVGGSYEAFQRQQLSAAAVSVGMSYEALTGDRRSTNDRTYRADVLEFTRLVTMWQYHMVVFTMCRPIWRRLVDLAIAAGKWTPPKGVKRRDYMRVTWTPPARGYIHPVQEVEAFKAAVAAGFTTRREVAAAMGSTTEETDLVNAREMKRAKEYGLNYSVYPEQGAEVASPIGKAGALLDKEVAKQTLDDVEKYVDDQAA